VRAAASGGGSDGIGEATGIALNGHGPDEPISGFVSLAPGDSAAIDVAATFTEAQVFRSFDILFYADEDGDGAMEPQASATLRYVENLAGTVAVPLPGTTPKQPTSLALSVLPNPARHSAVLQFWLPARGAVEIGLYDIVGRRVKTLLDATREAGPGSLPLELHSLPRGVYFVKLRTPGAEAVQRVVMVQ
jgi:Secretion system C-terminal sorting domain